MVVFGAESTGREIVAALGENVKGKIIVLTGPSEGGLGEELVTTLSTAEPAHLILAGRNEAKIGPVIEKVKVINPRVKATFLKLDLLDNHSVRQASDWINTTVEHVDVLINNAGVAARKNYETSRDGVEGHFAANYLGHFLLTNLIAAQLIKVKGVVINVSSIAYTLAETNVEDVNFNEGKEYHAWVAYGRSKTANILFTVALAEKYKDKIVALTIDPGMAHDTQLLTNSGVDEAFLNEGIALSMSRMEGKDVPPITLVTMQPAVASTLLAAFDPNLRDKGPIFVKECTILDVLPYAKDKAEALKLWELSERLVGGL